MLGIATRATEIATVCLLGAIAALAAAAALSQSGWAESVLFLASAIAAGAAIGRTPHALKLLAEHREPSNADFDG